MNKKNLYKILYLISLLLIILFIIFTIVDYITFKTNLYSAPFYIFIIVRIIEFILLSIIVFVIGKIIENKYLNK